MKVLLTGAFDWKDEDIAALRSNHWDIVYVEREDGTLPAEAYEVDAVICNWLFVHHRIESFKNLKFIQLLSAGLDRVPLDYIKEKNIRIYNARGIYSIPMAEFAVCGVLQLYKHSYDFYENKNEHRWKKQRDMIELNSKRVLVIGTGSVGAEVGKRFSAFTDDVYGIDINVSDVPFFKMVFSITELDIQLNQSDIVVLTLPLTEDTRNMFDEERFSHMKEGSVFVNVARGGLVKEMALIHAIDQKLFGAVLDVFENEPLPEDSVLWDKRNVILTPHNSFVSDQNEKRIRDMVQQHLDEYRG